MELVRQRQKQILVSACYSGFMHIYTIQLALTHGRILFRCFAAIVVVLVSRVAMAGLPRDFLIWRCFRADIFLILALLRHRTTTLTPSQTQLHILLRPPISKRTSKSPQTLQLQHQSFRSPRLRLTITRHFRDICPKNKQSKSHSNIMAASLLSLSIELVENIASPLASYVSQE